MQVQATVICSAAGPWGMVAAIESVMASQAQLSTKEFLSFCQQWCQDHRAESLRTPRAISGWAAAKLSNDSDHLHDTSDITSQNSFLTGTVRHAHATEDKLHRLL